MNDNQQIAFCCVQNYFTETVSRNQGKSRKESVNSGGGFDKKEKCALVLAKGWKIEYNTKL